LKASVDVDAFKQRSLVTIGYGNVEEQMSNRGAILRHILVEGYTQRYKVLIFKKSNILLFFKFIIWQVIYDIIKDCVLNEKYFIALYH
jgi:hypothetical protein